MMFSHNACRKVRIRCCNKPHTQEAERVGDAKFNRILHLTFSGRKTFVKCVLEIGHASSRVLDHEMGKCRGDIDDAEADGSLFVVFVGVGEELGFVEGDCESAGIGLLQFWLFQKALDRQLNLVKRLANVNFALDRRARNIGLSFTQRFFCYERNLGQISRCV